MLFRVIYVNRVILGYFGSFLVISGHFWSFLVILALLFSEKKNSFDHFIRFQVLALIQRYKIVSSPKLTHKTCSSLDVPFEIVSSPEFTHKTGSSLNIKSK